MISATYGEGWTSRVTGVRTDRRLETDDRTLDDREQFVLCDPAPTINPGQPRPKSPGTFSRDLVKVERLFDDARQLDKGD